MMNPTKTKNTFLSYFVLFVWGFLLMEVGLGQTQTSEIKVGVVLDLNTTFSKISLRSMNMSLADFYKDHPSYRTRLTLHVRDSMNDVVQASAAALGLIKNEQVSAIIGPRNSMQAEFMIRLANKTQVATITFSATSPLLTSIKSPYFVRATLDDSSQVKAFAAIFKYFRWRSVVAIHVDNELGEGLMPFLSDALKDVKVNRSVISEEANDDEIVKELRKLMTRQTRVFIVHMETSLALRVFQKAKEIGMMEKGYVWFMTNAMTHMMRHLDHGRSLNTIEGVLGVRNQVPKSKKLEDFSLRWKRLFRKENPYIKDDVDVNIYALWAYDSITALARAVEKTNLKCLGYDNVRASSNSKIDLATVGVSRYGPCLLKALSNERFKGLAGDFSLTDDMQLESSKFEIINFIENQEKIIWLWTPRDGLVDANTNKRKLGEVIWPGKSKDVPKGWDIPGKKIKVGVPLKRGFFQFVNTSSDSNTNTKTPTGYAIEIFEAALKELPYSVHPEYVLESPDVDYNELVYKVYNETWDAVVGDITITANRSLYADFTLPYTESGVSMMVPVRDNEDENTWVFLKPWSLELWVTTGCFVVLIGFVVWLFEHRVNPDFRGPPHHQIGTSFWFSFSTIVFANREKVVSNLARFVIVVWCFVVLVLIQSYTASLTSFLTVQRFQPTATNVNDLIRNRNINVGFQHGSFVEDILLGLGFQNDQLICFSSAEECDKLFSNGTIVAAFDEVAYLNIIISQYCSKYAMVEPTFKTAGFGFAFPKNSPLTGDISRAILNVTQGAAIEDIENKWFPNKNDCPDPITDLSSNRLSLTSFWVLFLIVGIASFLAVVVFVALFLYKHRHTQCDHSEDSIWRKLKSLFRIFDEKDIESHTFKNSAVHNVSSPMNLYTPSPSTVQITPWPQSPSQNMEFELRRVSFTLSEEHFSTEPIHHRDGESGIECGVELNNQS